MYLVIGDGRIEDMTDGCIITGEVHATLDRARAMSLSIGEGASVYGLEFKGQAVEVHRTDWHAAKDCPKKRFPLQQQEEVPFPINREPVPIAEDEPDNWFIGNEVALEDIER